MIQAFIIDMKAYMAVPLNENILKHLLQAGH